jgi:hypothetical protein
VPQHRQPLAASCTPLLCTATPPARAPAPPTPTTPASRCRTAPNRNQCRQLPHPHTLVLRQLCAASATSTRSCALLRCPRIHAPAPALLAAVRMLGPPAPALARRQLARSRVPAEPLRSGRRPRTRSCAPRASLCVARPCSTALRPSSRSPSARASCLAAARLSRCRQPPAEPRAPPEPRPPTAAAPAPPVPKPSACAARPACACCLLGPVEEREREGVDKAWGCAAGGRSKEGNAREMERGRTEEKGKKNFPRTYA